MKECAFCGHDFVATKGQQYCSDDCRIKANKEATERRKEEARRKRRKNADRSCIVCGAKLSMYGHGNTCAAHINPKPMSDIIRQIKGLI